MHHVRRNCGHRRVPGDTRPSVVGSADLKPDRPRSRARPSIRWCSAFRIGRIAAVVVAVAVTSRSLETLTWVLGSRVEAASPSYNPHYCCTLTWFTAVVMAAGQGRLATGLPTCLPCTLSSVGARAGWMGSFPAPRIFGVVEPLVSVRRPPAHPSTFF